MIELISKIKNLGSSFVIITDDIVENLYGNELLKFLTHHNLKGFLLSFSHGEKNKTRKTKEKLEDQMVKLGLKGDTCLIALGGGVVTDIGGYIAATYCRGIPLINVPTTLLGMVDASIGGKNGVNISSAKNFIGTYYLPNAIINSPAFLKTLPPSELKNGMAEMIKIAAILEADFFHFLETKHNLQKAIDKSIQLKNSIVQHENKKMRHLLNFGHTIGHALETVTKYKMSHGEAISIGMVVEAYLSYLLNFTDFKTVERLMVLLKKYEINLKFPKCSKEKIMATMQLDKKGINDKPRFVIIKKIGEYDSCDGNYCLEIENYWIEKALNDLYCY